MTSSGGHTAVRENWQKLVREAIEPGPAIPSDQLLMISDLTGRPLRLNEPPQGVAARPGAVLILLYPDGPDLRLPLTVRSNHLPNHRGEVSLPGGATDPQDDSPATTALRECHEEVGVEPGRINVWGELSTIYIPPSNFSITPIVGFTAPAPTLNVNSNEVSAVITVTLHELLDPANVVRERWAWRGIEAIVPFFMIAGHKVWGATALILSELVAKIRRAQYIDHS